MLFTFCWLVSVASIFDYQNDKFIFAQLRELSLKPILTTGYSGPGGALEGNSLTCQVLLFSGD